MAEDCDQSSRPSMAAWRDKPGLLEFQAREEADQERRERLASNYRQAQLAGCAHGWERKVFPGEPLPRPGLVCRAGKCGIIWITLAEALDQWKAQDMSVTTLTAEPEPEPSPSTTAAP
ncbi:MAG: hypothetical protein WA709_18405 [Stellaceae bacterium]